LAQKKHQEELSGVPLPGEKKKYLFTWKYVRTSERTRNPNDLQFQKGEKRGEFLSGEGKVGHVIPQKEGKGKKGHHRQLRKGVTTLQPWNNLSMLARGGK